MRCEEINCPCNQLEEGEINSCKYCPYIERTALEDAWNELIDNIIYVFKLEKILDCLNDKIINAKIKFKRMIK